MKILAPAVLLLGFAALPATASNDNPMDEVCRAKAASESGYSGANPGLGRTVGRVQLSISGSAAIGGTWSSGPTDGVADYGDGAAERQEDRARAQYTRIYENCIAQN